MWKPWGEGRCEHSKRFSLFRCSKPTVARKDIELHMHGALLDHLHVNVIELLMVRLA
jgi:hypothetical protein